MTAAAGIDAHYDVIVAGGGSGGVAAAVGAAQAGAKTLLVERAGFLGGAATLSQVLAWCGFYPQADGAMPEPAVAGVGRLALDHLAALGMDVAPYFSASGNWPIRLNPEATKIALDRSVAAAGVTVALHTSVTRATAAGRVEAVVLQDPRGLHDVTADSFVDASGDAALAFLAGASPCPLHVPDRGAQPASYPVRLSGAARGASLDKSLRAKALDQIDRRLGLSLIHI